MSVFSYPYTAAMEDFDYTSINTTVSFASGSAGGTEACADISILDDAVLESDQTFFVRVSSSDPDLMLTTIITITDNDSR